MIPDVNILVALQRLDHVHHKAAKKWLDLHAQQGGEIILLEQAVAGCLRLVTHAKIYQQPSTTEEATDFIDSLLENARVHWNQIGSQAVWESFKQLATTMHIKENTVPDAWIATQALAQNTRVVTFDKDFKKLLPAEHLILLQA